MNDLQTGEGAKVTELVSGIVKDAQDLIRQQLALFQHEVEEGFRQAKQAAVFVAIGSGVAFLGVTLLCLMLVYLAAWASPELPLWVCFSMVGAPLAIIGIALIYGGVHQLRATNVLPNQSAEALKENLQWITNPK